MTTATGTLTAHGANAALPRSPFEAVDAGAVRALAAHDGVHQLAGNGRVFTCAAPGLAPAEDA